MAAINNPPYLEVIVFFIGRVEEKLYSIAVSTMQNTDTGGEGGSDSDLRSRSEGMNLLSASPHKRETIIDQNR